MATENQQMFMKFKQLSTIQKDDTNVEVRVDEEQGLKLQEIIDLLVAAGYFRARIKGLSSFDKVVGGMTWCIESCNVDLDVDLLFQENSTIGQKISLTEKIVAVLPKLKCPHLIEPHQIQGLDFIHIFPVIQWLVKRSMEFREKMSASLRRFAIKQFNRDFDNSTVESKKTDEIFENLCTVNEMYRPHRYYKRKTSQSDNIDSNIKITLLEYGLRGSRNIAQNKKDNGVEESTSDQYDQILNNMAVMNDDFFLYEDLVSHDKERLLKHYLTLQTEIKEDNLRSSEEEKLLLLEEKRKILLEYCDKLAQQKDKWNKEIVDCTAELKLFKREKQETEKSLHELEESAQKHSNIKEVEDLVILNDDLRSQELRFREHCKQELAKLQGLIEETKKAKTPVINEEENQKEIDEENENLRQFRLQVAKKTRIVAGLQRQLDDVPGRAELAQYQSRFIELFNQVAAKHKETKQYFTLHNTLEDSKQYMIKEMSLLNSISDSYPKAMETNNGKEEFLTEFEKIGESVRLSKMKLDRRLSEEKHKRDQLQYKLQNLLDLQRKYVTAVRNLSIECKRQEGNVIHYA
ncbi:PREDICTED: coiled-coil domain-containing protein 93 isoform X2 [Nicrophorus vespilloides]|uniref:Coiled-coil domain-containing protein 93 n=1 Tax=Nicrophorus vespilloides TaxID=110193 RepID=A0ABM1MMC9_NICVS|nr:PREDICTED: coiled-coil domain-containing protein 93 isoform X2 [Nicrophorus vespilloides]